MAAPPEVAEAVAWAMADAEADAGEGLAGAGEGLAGDDEPCVSALAAA